MRTDGLWEGETEGAEGTGEDVGMKVQVISWHYTQRI